MDRITPEQRSRIMSRIRGRDTKPETLVRQRLFAAGWRFRVCDRRFPGRPDIVVARARTLIDVRGCFWHRHDCELIMWCGLLAFGQYALRCAPMPAAIRRVWHVSRHVPTLGRSLWGGHAGPPLQLAGAAISLREIRR